MSTRRIDYPELPDPGKPFVMKEIPQGGSCNRIDRVFEVPRHDDPMRTPIARHELGHAAASPPRLPETTRRSLWAAMQAVEDARIQLALRDAGAPVEGPEMSTMATKALGALFHSGTAAGLASAVCGAVSTIGTDFDPLPLFSGKDPRLAAIYTEARRKLERLHRIARKRDADGRVTPIAFTHGERIAKWLERELLKWADPEHPQEHPPEPQSGQGGAQEAPEGDPSEDPEDPTPQEPKAAGEAPKKPRRSRVFAPSRRAQDRLSRMTEWTIAPPPRTKGGEPVEVLWDVITPPLTVRCRGYWGRRQRTQVEEGSHLRRPERMLTDGRVFGRLLPRNRGVGGGSLLICGCCSQNFSEEDLAALLDAAPGQTTIGVCSGYGSGSLLDSAGSVRVVADRGWRVSDRMLWQAATRQGDGGWRLADNPIDAASVRDWLGAQRHPRIYLNSGCFGRAVSMGGDRRGWTIHYAGRVRQDVNSALATAQARIAFRLDDAAAVLRGERPWASLPSAVEVSS